MDINSQYGKIASTAELGRMIRQKRKADGLSQIEAGQLCDLGPRFIGDVERGKATSEIGKVLKLVQGLGLELVVLPRGIDL